MSGVINQVKPFAGIIDTSGQVLEKHTTTVVNNNETLIEQEEVIKRSTFNMTKFNSNLKEGGSKFSDGIKELSGGLVDFGDMFDTIGKKFKAIGDIGRGIASPVTSLFSAFEKDDDFADSNSAHLHRKNHCFQMKTTITTTINDVA